MKLMITTPDINNTDYGLEFVNLICVSATNCPFKAHSLTEDPEDADAILFINRGGGEYSELLRNNSLVKKFFHKSFIYESSDSPIDFMRGIYVSMPKAHFNIKRHRAYGYLASINEFIEPYVQNFQHQPDLVFSFMGAATSPIRKTLFHKQLFIELPETLIENTSSWSNWNSHNPLREERTKRYAETLARSKFVLCPRGGGTSSHRLFETMQMGRVPIILADNWVAPVGPEWELFSIRVAENRISEIPQLLTLYEHRYEEMGEKAQQAWEEWFSPKVQFHRLAENILSLLDESRSGDL
ncbi:exostosin domain-containing protein [Nostoc sp.]|uniref:exostosin domain-containing protein n=1 Tax=Nostoc sp. TaxID=1180 RepID=UPI002FF56BBD